jgi:chromosome segregation ATPase
MNETRDAYVKDMKVKIEGWNKTIEKFQVKANQTTADVLEQYKREIEKLKLKRKEYDGKMSELESSGEAAWEDLKSGVDKAWQTMGDTLHAATSRFR